MGASIHPDFAPYNPQQSGLQTLLDALIQRRQAGIQQQQVDVQKARLPLEARQTATGEMNAQTSRAEVDARAASEQAQTARLKAQDDLKAQKEQADEKAWTTFVDAQPEGRRSFLSMLHAVPTMGAEVQTILAKQMFPEAKDLADAVRRMTLATTLFVKGNVAWGRALMMVDPSLKWDDLDKSTRDLKAPKSSAEGLREEQNALRTQESLFSKTHTLLTTANRDIEKERERILTQAQGKELSPPPWDAGMQHELNAYTQKKYPSLSQWVKDENDIRDRIKAHGGLLSGFQTETEKQSALENQVNEISNLIPD